MKIWRLPLRVIHLMAVLLLGIALASLICLLQWLIPKAKRMGLLQRITQFFLHRLSAALPFSLSVHGVIPKGPHLWLSNHISWTDIPLIGQLLPLSFLAKSEVRQWPVAGWIAATAGTLFIQRYHGESRQVATQIAQHLARGHSVLVFPEGTSSDGQQLRHFHSRLISAALEAQVPIQPVAIRYTRAGQTDLIAPFIGDDNLLSHLMRLLASPAAEVQIHLLTPLSCEEGCRDQLAKRSQALIANALGHPLKSSCEAA